jgi:hypothetical protein
LLHLLKRIGLLLLLLLQALHLLLWLLVAPQGRKAGPIRGWTHHAHGSWWGVQQRVAAQGPTCCCCPPPLVLLLGQKLLQLLDVHHGGRLQLRVSQGCPDTPRRLLLLLLLRILLRILLLRVLLQRHDQATCRCRKVQRMRLHR